MNLCFMFPGQGTQKPGMLRELGNRMEAAAPIFQAAKEATGRDVQELCLTASAEELQRTENTQLAVTAMNLAYLNLLRQDGIKPDVTMGHSLGQFSALVAAECLRVEQVFSVVQKRAELMSQVTRPGMLCSVIGLELSAVEQICKDVDPTGQRLVVALHNTPNQIVMGGEPETVTQAEAACKQAGALRTVPIRVSHAFHTPLMQQMEQMFGEFLKTVDFAQPKCKLMLNCKGDFATSVAEIKQEIVAQCCHPVLWTEGVKKVIASTDEMLFAEVGVGKVLTGMMRSIDNHQTMLMLSNPAQYNKFIKLGKGGSNV